MIEDPLRDREHAAFGPARTDAPPRLQAAYDVIVVGAGLAGLFAGALAAGRGARTLVVGRGVGGTHLGPGSIDLWGYVYPAPGQPRLVEDPLAAAREHAGPQHPLALAGLAVVPDAFAALQALCAEAGYPLVGQADHNHWLPTALGAVRPTCLAPESFLAGEVRQHSEVVLADLPGFRDFYAGYASANLRAAGMTARAVKLELPRLPARRDAYATDLARLFDDDAFRAEAARLWRPHLRGAQRLGVPAVLGYLRAPEAWRELGDRLGLPLFEIPLLPPSVPGMRLFNVLRRALEAAGGRLVVGPGVSGWVAATGAPRVRGVVAETAGGSRWYAAERVILATGGFRHGGLLAPAAGQAREGVFNLPVAAEGEWFAPFYFDPQPFARFGVRVNAHMQPVAADGAVLYPNLFAAGGVLAGADRYSEGSREGVDLVTAQVASLAAVEGLAVEVTQP